MRNLLIVALGLTLTYELVAAVTHRWFTISQLTWHLESQHPGYAMLVLVGFVALGIHLFVRRWRA